MTKRNFILQQGLREPPAGTCSTQYSALLFQPRLVGCWVVVATVLRSPALFLALAAVLWWSAWIPRRNPFDALYNRTFGRTSGTTLRVAPAPRLFAQDLAASFALVIGVSFALGWSDVGFVLAGVFIVAIGAVVFGGFCFGAWLFHVLSGHAGFARRTLPWATGA